ncbi:hypothetical protein N7470_000349 [Penicillium chermesinum]|nr:hypothetical protein N7470_000349 [Penicillium chermesinum]
MAELKAVHNASAEYAAVSTDTDTQKAMKKRLRIAHQVMKLRDDLIEYETLSDQENRHRTELYIKEFLNTLSLENLAFVGTTHLRLLKPYLGPFPGENIEDEHNYDIKAGNIQRDLGTANGPLNNMVHLNKENTLTCDMVVDGINMCGLTFEDQPS